MSELFHNGRGLLALFPALVFWLLLASQWSSASAKGFLGLAAAAIGMTLLMLNFAFRGIGNGLAGNAGMFCLLFGGVMQLGECLIFGKLPKGTRIKRVVSTLKVLGIPVWRKVVSTEILPPEQDTVWRREK